MKEAAYKALQTTEIPFNSIEVLSVKDGIRSPLQIELNGKAGRVAHERKIGVFDRDCV